MKTAANYDRHIVSERQPVWDEESGRGRMGLLRFVQKTHSHHRMCNHLEHGVLAMALAFPPVPSGRSMFLAAESLQNLMVSRAEGGTGDDGLYRSLRAELVDRTELRSLIPRFVETCRDQHQFWAYIKGQFGTYQERRQFIWAEFAPLLKHLETGARSPADADILATLDALNPDDVGNVWRRALERRVSDPEGAITIARSLLETVCKHIIDGSGGSYGHADDLPKLYHIAATQLSLAPSQHTEEVFKQILGGCQSVVNGLGALRNRLGDAHGKGKQPIKPSARHAELAVNLAGAMATFLTATWKERQTLPEWIASGASR